MGFDEGQIVLNSDNGTFFPGQILSGRLEFDLQKVKKFRGIYAEIKGTCKVHWTTSHSRRVNDRTEHYTVTHESYEEYMNVTVYLIGSKSGEQTLHPGRHVFPFECQIPPHCPSSFEGSHGSVRYKVKVTVDRAFKIDQTKMAAFRVVAPLNLNEIPNAREPLEIPFEQTFCCWCMNSGMAETLVKVPARGWCPGQVIPIEVACTNTSSVELDVIKFTILKTTSFEAVNEPDHRSEEEKVAQIKKGPVPANTTRNYTVDLQLPDMDAPNLNSCRFIKISYKFKVEIETSGCHTDEDQTFDIFIGNIPLTGGEYMPGPETALNAPGVNHYPAPPVINQPGYTNGAYPPAQPYPPNPNLGFNPQNTPYPTPFPAPYPNVTPYPGNVGPNPPVITQNLTTSAPYSNPGESPYPSNPGYNPGQNQPLPNQGPYPQNAITPNTPYRPANSPYPPANTPYPPANTPYPPANTPYPPGNSPYPPPNTPYPPGNSPYPPAAPYAGNAESNTLLKAGFPGSNGPETMPLLPPGSVPRPASPFATASAPASAPDDYKRDDKVPPPYPQ